MSDHQLDTLLPHRPPMQLIDAVVASDTTRLWASLHIRPDTLFLEGSIVPADVGLEYLAQAAAAFFTVRAGHGEPRAGMLIACPRYAVHHAGFGLHSNLLIGIEIASPLPASDRSGLVRFRGVIEVLDEPLPTNCGPKDVMAARAQKLIDADLSVYI